MKKNSSLNILFAINPVSGGKDKTDWQEGIRVYFKDSPHCIELLELTGQQDDRLLRDRIGKFRPDRIVAVGGDGTVKIVAQEVIEAKGVLGILPAGSANGMARELAIPALLTEALDVVVGGRVQAIDTLCINDDLCLHLSDIGINAQLVKNAQDNNWKGKFGYARAMLRVLLRHRLMEVRIKADDEVVQRQAFMVVLANARLYGTGAMINPDGNINDGLFEVVVLRKLAGLEILKMFWQFRPFDPEKIEIFHTSSVRLETRRHVHFQVDGEYRGKVKTIEATIQPGQLRVVLPEK